MSGATLPSTSETSLVTSRLAQLRSKISLWFWIDGLSRIAWGALLLSLADLILDYLFRMDLSQRAVMLALMIAATVWIAYKWLFLPLSQVPSDDALCLRVEAANKHLGESLISALQLARLPEDKQHGMSPLLMNQTIRMGMKRAQEVDFSNVLDSLSFRFHAILLVLALGLSSWCVISIAAFPSGILRIWAERNLLLMSTPWPQSTNLEIERAVNGKVVFPRGEDWTQFVTVAADSKIFPDSVHIDFRRARGRQSQAMKRTTEQPTDGSQRFEAVFNNVLEPFEFRARGGDAYTDWVQVELVDPPAVDSLELEVTPPQYANLAPEKLPPGRGPYYVLRGSSLAIQGTSTKPLASASIVIDDEKSIELKVDNSLSFSGVVDISNFVAGQYTIVLKDELGLSSRRNTSFGIRIRLDREPRVRMRLLGVSGVVVPKARIPLAGRLTDDFGIVSSQIEYSWTTSDTERKQGDGTVALESLTKQLPALEVDFADVVELEPLAIPTGSALTLRIAARDNDNVKDDAADEVPNVGKSSDFLLRVVTEDELRADLLRREKEQRQEFERLLKNEEDILTETRALEATTNNSAALESIQKDMLLQLQRRQKQVASNTAAIAERFSGFVLEVENNRIEEPGGKLQTRLTKEIVEPMQLVSGPMASESIAKLDETRRQSADVKPRGEAFAQAVAVQQKMVDEMRLILSRMVKAEGFQEAVNLLYEIQKSQQDVYDRTMKEKAERIQNILEKEGSTPTPPAPQTPVPQSPAPPEAQPPATEPAPAEEATAAAKE
ncbi:hypothetical protein Psta_2695 [Pirellula staleyi DSM 6068]|uniref:Polyketide synthase-like protein n=1 Tax=Pirellula staleyi (strain ATCC 27377 / DSM 6068 / ICPB 4128) TaxID=530564 RepID=D2R6R3_PIRSD|nr:hypothetical protein [Pirellula staleyi]ADB17363.1 hypothetical protein Psta_2695 [Pirellula staleyi DSM 6068]